MNFKLTVTSVTAAIVAGVSAFGVAYSAAGSNGTPGVQPSEWIQIGLSTLIAVVAALFHDNRPQV